MKGKAFGLDIGATTVKVVSLTKAQNGYFLNAAMIAPTPGKGMTSESPLDQEELAQGIRRIIDEVRITSSLVHIALPENQVYTKVIEMPVLSDKELTSAIYWEAEQHIPVPLETVTIDWKVLRRPVNEPSAKMEVLLVGAPTLLIERYQKILALSGLTIATVETEILSTIRALVYSSAMLSQNMPPPTIIVHIGAFSTSLAIVKDGIISFTYSIPLGGTAINRAIAADFGFTIAQAEEYKKTYGISQSGLGVKISKASEPILTSILSEVKKALTFYSEKYNRDEPIRQIILSGGNAKLPGLNVFFAQNCGIESVIANPWKILINQQLPAGILDKAPDYSIAVGLAMRDYEQH